MKLAALEAFGISEEIISIWQRYIKDGNLLPVQVKAIKEFGLFEGKNILAFSPTSSGKTFIGEMVAIKSAMENKRIFYLVPQKALAEEKFREFQQRYQEHGVKIVISTKDRKEYDQDINRGDFRIAIVVFEKMQSLLVSNPGLIINVGLIVLDELQMIGDPVRGPKLELLLTKILLSEGNPQFIGLSAVLGKSQDLANWLNAGLLELPERPVELRRGILQGNAFRYEEYNSRRAGKETLAKCPEDTQATEAIMGTNIELFARQGEQSLIFCSSKKESVKMANWLAETLQLPPVKEFLAELEDFDDTLGKEALKGLLSRGVAYHNADLDWDQRELVERYFRENKIMALCSTSTLAMGMNLPVKNVFVDTKRWQRSHPKGWTTVPITQAEYENMSGRAGRLNHNNDFGRAIIVADSDFEATTLFNNYVHGHLGDIEPSLDKDALSHHILSLVASGMCSSKKEIETSLLRSFTGMMIWNKDETSRKEFKARLAEDIKQCLEGELLICDDQVKLQVTEVGRICAAKGILVETAIQFHRFAKEEANAAHLVNELELFLWVNISKDGQEIYFNLSTSESRGDYYSGMLRKLTSSFSPKIQERFEKITSQTAFSYDQTQIIKKTLILYDWVNGVDTMEIEDKFYCYSGSIYNMAGESAWLMEALAEIAKVSGWEEKEADRIRQLADRMIYGVKPEALEIASLRVNRFGRKKIHTLLDSGLNTVQKLKEVSQRELEKLFSKDMAKKLKDKIFRIEPKIAEAEEPTGTNSLHPISANKVFRKRGISLPQIVPNEPLTWEQEFQSGLKKLTVVELKSLQQAISTLKHNKLQHLFDDLEARLKKDELKPANRIFNKFLKDYQQVTSLLTQSTGISLSPDIDDQLREIAQAFQHSGPPTEIRNKLIALKRGLRKTLTRAFNYLEEMQHNLNSLAQIALESKQNVLQDQGIQYNLDLENEENMVELFMDKDEVTDALLNLIQNAAESFPSGRKRKQITLKTCRNNGSIELRVIDNGRGIERERWESVFDPGHTTKGSDGLGLALVKKAVLKNGGDICIENSRLGKGTSFKIIFEV